LAFSCGAQTNTNLAEKPVMGIPITTNTPASASPQPLVLNSDGSISVSPDLLNVIPVKYKSLAILLIALTPTLIKIAHELKTPGSTVGSALINSVTGKSQAVINEVYRLNHRTGISNDAPAPAAPKTVPVVPPAAPLPPPLTTLPPVASQIPPPAFQAQSPPQPANPPTP
jgi:hypothetical protein